MSVSDKYFSKISAILEQITRDERQSIGVAAELVASMVEKDRLVHVYGSGGHSIMGAMEVFWRAGGLANVNALFPAGISLVDSHPNYERVPGLSNFVLEYYGVKNGDVLIIINVNGINAITIDAALYAKGKGARVVAVTSPEFSDNVPAGIPARHPSNKNLYEIADIVVDVHVPAGDSVISIDGLEQTVGASSTFAVCFALNLIFIQAVELLVGKGITPPIWTSANVAGGDEANKCYLEKYRPVIHHLYPS